ncbi:MAG TPA: hypothetical protein VFL27_14320 [Candidatus Dormibacteraeota bacterium]|nr:hypothetical protein [Candidatus Dormibacteraeota bacterium]
MTAGIAAASWAVLFAALAAAAFNIPEGAIAGFALAAGSAGGFGIAVWAVVRLVRWPPARLCFFRDRLVVIQGRHEMRALWSAMEAVTLSEPLSERNPWPSVKVTDRLTIRFRNEAPLSFRPASFGLQPVACRDLIVRLRDDSRLRSRLPEFDSVRDLAISPVVAGELIEPRL